MEKHEAAAKLEEITVHGNPDAATAAFLKFYHNGGVHKAVEAGRTIDHVFAMVEAKAVLPVDVKEALKVIFA